MSSAAPLVSIGVPVFQKQAHLEESLAALLGQEYRALELILADNGSTDASAELCRDFARRDPRVRCFRHQENIGSRRNFNFVFELARGEFFAWNRGHDRPAPDFVARGVAALRSHPDAVLYHARCHEIDADGRDLGPVDERLDTRGFHLADRLRSVWRHVLGPATFGLIRTGAMRRTRLYQALAGCDIVFLLELAVQGAFIFDPESAFTIRRMRSESSEEESVLRTWKQIDPFHMPPEPPAHHVLQFIEEHLRVLSELPLEPARIDELTIDLFAVYGERFCGSLARALDALAARIAAPEHLDLATAVLYLRRLDLGLLLCPDHEPARAAREALGRDLSRMHRGRRA